MGRIVAVLAWLAWVLLVVAVIAGAALVIQWQLGNVGWLRNAATYGSALAAAVAAAGIFVAIGQLRHMANQTQLTTARFWLELLDRTEQRLARRKMYRDPLPATPEAIVSLDPELWDAMETVGNAWTQAAIAVTTGELPERLLLERYSSTVLRSWYCIRPCLTMLRTRERGEFFWLHFDELCWRAFRRVAWQCGRKVPRVIMEGRDIGEAIHVCVRQMRWNRRWHLHVYEEPTADSAQAE